MTLPRKIFLVIYTALAATAVYFAWRQQLYLPLQAYIDEMMGGGASFGYAVAGCLIFAAIFGLKDVIWSGLLYLVDISLGISKFSSHKRAQMRRAISCQRRLHFAEAGTLFEEVDELSRAADCYTKAGQWENAARVLEFIGEHKRAAKLYEKADLFEQAAAIYSKANDEVGATQLHLRSAERALHENRLRAAADHFLEAKQPLRAAETLERMENFEEAGKVFMRGGYFDRAVESYTRLVRAIDDALEAGKAPPGGMSKIKPIRLAAAQALEKADAHAEAARQYAKADSWEKAGELYTAAGMHEKATECYIKSGNNGAARESMRRSGNLEQLKEYTALDALDTGNFSQAAKAFIELGQLDKAMEAYRRGKNPIGMAEVYLKMGRYVSAAEQFALGGDLGRAAEMYELGQDFVEAAELFRETGNLPKAIECLEAEGNHYSAGMLQAELGQNTKAIASLQQVKHDHPEYARCCSMLGRLFSAEGAVEQAQRYFEIAMERNVRTTTLIRDLYNLATQLEEMGRHRDAATLYKRVTDLDYGYEEAAERLQRIRAEMPHLFSSSSGSIPQPAVPSQPPAPVTNPGHNTRNQTAQMSADPPTAEFASGFATASGRPLTAVGTQPGFPNPNDSISTGSAMVPDRYELLEEVGRGGMGVVYKARDTTLDRVVALKMLPSAICSESQEDYQNFIREARTIAKLSHRHIVTIYDIGRRGDRYYFSMEYVGGSSLRRHIAEQGRLPLAEVMRISREVCEALAYAHERGIVHRDIKPGNILLTEEMITKIVDFGLAKIVSEHPANADGPATFSSGFMKGTPHYMSPEQIRGEHLDHRTDVYAFGLTLYFMLTGQNVFDAFQCKSPMEVVDHQLKTDLPSPLKMRPELPPEIELIYFSCIEKDREKRFSSMRDAMDQLGAVPVG